jgi:putative ABC transport system permease protein
MSQRSTSLIARRSIRSRLGRTIAIAFAIAISVAFVVGSFVLADSLKSSFDSLFSDLTENVDLEVRSRVAFGDEFDNQQRDPVAPEILATVEGVPGVAVAQPAITRYAQIIYTETDSDGEPEDKALTTGGGPTLGVSWSEGDEQLSTVTFREGRPPAGPDEVAVDKVSADEIDATIGDEIRVTTDTGTASYTITGIVTLGDTDGFGGASISVFDLDTAMEVLGTDGAFDVIDIMVEDGADPATVQRALVEALPDNIEVITGEELAEESSDAIGEIIGVFGTGLLIFAFVTAFVSAFIINNVFAITIGQRLRELALLRAIGAGGSQVRRMIIVEALVMSVIATIVGIVLGIGVARLLISVFNAAGAGFPDTGTVMAPRTIVMAFVVGVGITMASVIIPARRAAKIPPVAAMRPELGFAALNTRRLVLATSVTVIGAVLFLVGLFVRPGGTLGLGLMAGGGGLLIFLGVAGVSSTIATPATRTIGWPIAKLFGTPGRLARDNAGRNPRRTSSSAAALMIGVALVSAAAVFATSLRHTFVAIMDRGVQADFVVVNSSSFFGLPPTIADALRDLPELSAVSGVSSLAIEIDGDEKALGGGDPQALEQLVEIDLQEGSWDDLGLDDLFVHTDPADDLDLEIGDTVSGVFRNGESAVLTVKGIFDDNALVGSWLTSSETVEAHSSTPPLTFFIAAKTADGVDQEQARDAMEDALAEFPQAEVQTADEFRDEQASQIDALLVIITALLVFAIIIAVLGISITLALAVFERTREIGLLRAVGMNKRQTRRTVRWESVIVSLFGAVIGIVVGSLLGVALSYAVPDSIIDGISFSFSTMVLILIGAVIAGLVAGLYPSFKASRMDVLEAIVTE